MKLPHSIVGSLLIAKFDPSFIEGYPDFFAQKQTGHGDYLNLMPHASSILNEHPWCSNVMVYHSSTSLVKTIFNRKFIRKIINRFNHVHV